MITLLSNEFCEVLISASPARSSERTILKYRVKLADHIAKLTIGQSFFTFDNEELRIVDISELVLNSAIAGVELPITVEGILPISIVYTLTTNLPTRMGLAPSGNLVTVPDQIAYFNDGFNFWLQVSENESVKFNGTPYFLANYGPYQNTFELTFQQSKMITPDFSFFCDNEMRCLTWRSQLGNLKSWAFEVIGYEVRALSSTDLLYSEKYGKIAKTAEFFRLRAELNRFQQLYLADLFASDYIIHRDYVVYIEGMDKLECTDEDQTINFYIYKRK